MLILPNKTTKKLSYECKFQTSFDRIGKTEKIEVEILLNYSFNQEHNSFTISRKNVHINRNVDELFNIRFIFEQKDKYVC